MEATWPPPTTSGTRKAWPDAEAVQALLLGLTIKRLLDAELTWDRALALLRRVVCALGHESGA